MPFFLFFVISKKVRFFKIPSKKKQRKEENENSYNLKIFPQIKMTKQNFNTRSSIWKVVLLFYGKRKYSFSYSTIIQWKFHFILFLAKGSHPPSLFHVLFRIHWNKFIYFLSFFLNPESYILNPENDENGFSLNSGKLEDNKKQEYKIN